MLLTERFAPLMAQALHCAESAEGLALSLDEIQRRLLSLAEEERGQIWEEKSILYDDSAKNNLDDARFAVYAWVDEKMLNAQRADASAWMPLSLQYHYFSTTEAGQQFFARLTILLDRLSLAREDAKNPLDLATRLELAQNLAKEQDGMELLRVFALCLLYGFRGRLFGQEELLQRVRKACLPLVRRPQVTSIFKPSADKPKRTGFAYYLERTAYVLVPVLCCALFWLYCANLLAHIPGKGL